MRRGPTREDTLVVRRRHGPHALLRFRRRRDPLPSGPAAMRSRLSATDVHAQIQAVVRRILLSQAPEGAPRSRRHLLRRSRRRWFRPLLRADAKRRRPAFSTLTFLSSGGARKRRMASASGISRRIGAAAMWNSISFGIAVRCSGCSPNGRTEAILMSLPPVVKWRYDWTPAAGYTRGQALHGLLVAKDWLE